MLKRFKKNMWPGVTAQERSKTQLKLSEFSRFLSFHILSLQNQRFSLQTNPYNFDGYATMPMDMLPSKSHFHLVPTVVWGLISR